MSAQRQPADPPLSHETRLILDSLAEIKTDVAEIRREQKRQGKLLDSINTIVAPLAQDMLDSPK